jgi:uncharacterized protein (TIGR02271 family)
MSHLQKDQLLQQRGQDLYDSHDDKIGKIDEIYLDHESGEPEWALVNTGLFGTKSTFVPLGDVSERDGTLSVPYEKGHVKDAPSMDADGELSSAQEDELYRYYDLTDSRGEFDSDRDRDTGDVSGTVGHDVSGPTTDDAMTRSEEELRVGTTERETGRVRLRKYVVEDEVTETVPVRREEIRVEREPITDGNVDDAMDGPAISEEEHEVVLREEEVVVDKRAVPKERVRLEKDSVTEEERVSETLRKEEIDVDENRR